ncbi:hypothetical protein [Streptomyces sp. NPDC001380]|uniref:tetratricopeptide repeat protein n=1 Tax=Streptomyces sp. NPDC001380 TaxID=3364566 RepID=UPI0036D1A01B
MPPRAASVRRAAALCASVRRAAALAAAGIAAAASVAAVVLGPAPAPRPQAVRPPVPVRVAPAAAPLDRLGTGDLARGIAALQARLRARPRDDASWAALGQAYVEQARTTADPARYPQAERALHTSLRLRPQGNDAAVAGLASLAAARHDFARALTEADRALALNPYGERALAVRIDALVELGRYDDARRAAEEADRRRPGIPVFTRCAYVLELRGDTAGARRVLLRARAAATAPSDVAYTATALGELARSRADHREALRRYAEALRADPGHLAALEGRARTRAAQGDLRAAAVDMAAVVRRFPLPDRLAFLGDLDTALGDREQARRQYAVTGAWTALARAGGVATDLETALVAADHGDPADAVRAARAEWGRRHGIHVADAYAWALHRAGDDRRALDLARRATATGYRNALFLYHRGIIEKALGRDADARRSLRAALSLDPGFAPLDAPRARAALAALDGAGPEGTGPRGAGPGRPAEGRTR